MVAPRGDLGWGLLMEPLVTNRPSETLLIVKGDDRGDPALTKRICGFASLLVLGPVIPKTLKMGVVPACMVLRMK